MEKKIGGVHLLVGGFSPTHLKSMLVKMDHFPYFSGEKICDTTT